MCAAPAYEAQACGRVAVSLTRVYPAEHIHRCAIKQPFLAWMHACGMILLFIRRRVETRYTGFEESEELKTENRLSDMTHSAQRNTALTNGALRTFARKLVRPIFCLFDEVSSTSR